jgi:uncharacterized protein YjbJ (UPF0337 family)
MAGNDDIARGKIDQLKGRVKKALGELTDDPGRKAEGTLDKAKGTAEELKGRIKKDVEREFDDV